MKVRTYSGRPSQGSVMVVTVCLAFVIGVSLISYLWLVHSQNRMVARSQQWGAAIAHAEAGVEEALAQLNHKFGTNLNRAANGWGGPANGVYGPVSRTLKTGAYSVTISDDYPVPVIISTGYSTNGVTGDVVHRTLRVVAATTSAFQVGMAAKLNVTFMGNNIHIDSFDSADPAHDDPLNPAEVKAGGDVASTDGIVQVGNANVNGRILTGPTGSYSFGPNGWAGPIGWNGPGLYSSDWYKNDFNADFKNVDAPFDPQGVLQPPLVSTPGKNGTNYYELGAGNYYYDGALDLNNKNIVATQNATLWVTGNFIQNANSQIFVNPNVNLKIYIGKVTGLDASTVLNKVNTAPAPDSNAASFQYYGLPSNKSVTWNGNDMYKGTVYAPQATLNLGGGGATVYDYQGACVVYQIVMNGHFNFHYDENLKKRDPVSGFTAGSWLEM